MNWQLDGRCFGMDTELFFPVTEKTDPPAPQVSRAKAICATCPVAAECLLDALVQRDVYGIRGGYTGAEREQILRKAA